MPLSPHQRITLIRGIADALAAEDWPLVDLSLQQFALPWSDRWDGSKTNYLLTMLRDAPDHSLAGLAEHVGLHFDEAGPPGIAPPFWREGMLRVFVTHLAAERRLVGSLQEELFRFGISCFVAHNDIEPTSEWQNEIETALRTCEALIALLHPRFHESKWTDQEIGFAMGRAVPVFTVRLGQDPYGFIGKFQAFNGDSKKTIAVLARELFDAYRRNKQTQRRMAEVLVSLFEESDSFAHAKERVGYLEELETWDPSLSSRIKLAAERNSQIKEAFGVPGRVNGLARKWSTSGD